MLCLLNLRLFLDTGTYDLSNTPCHDFFLKDGLFLLFPCRLEAVEKYWILKI